MGKKYQHFCLGFIFSRDLSSVYLVRKLRPEYQKGKLNGIGGKVEHGESPAEAMHRESVEECGYVGIWRHYGSMGNLEENAGHQEQWLADLFYSVMRVGDTEPQTMEDQPVIAVKINDIISLSGQMMANLPWLIMTALDNLKGEYGKFSITVNYR